jgi:hypothetical protein
VARKKNMPAFDTILGIKKKEKEREGLCTNKI